MHQQKYGYGYKTWNIVCVVHDDEYILVAIDFCKYGSYEQPWTIDRTHTAICEHS